MEPVLGPRRAKSEEELRPIVAAARQCFAQYGVSKTRMDDVAKAARMPRPYLYEYVTGRAELVELALLERAREFADTLAAGVDLATDDVAGALLEALMASIQLARVDVEFAYLAEAISRVRLNLLLTGRRSPVHVAVRGVFDGLFERARERGVLRVDVSEEAMVEWLQGVMTWLTPRVDLEDEELRELLRGFAVPAVLIRT
jgi:AcrR family transcriptional regulator